MKLTTREMVLGWTTGLVLLLAFSIWLCAPKIKVWKELNEQRATVMRRIEMAERTVAQRETWNGRLRDVAQRLTKYPADQDVTADYLKILETIVKENGVTLVQRRPQKEKKNNNLYELAIDCTWEAELEALVRFLFALEQQKVTMDIDDLAVSLVAGGQKKLKGNFALICLYTREGSAAAPQAAPPKPAPSKRPEKESL